MAKWMRLDCMWRRHPKHKRAGSIGRDVTAAIWEIAKTFDVSDGDITKYWDAEYIADWLDYDDAYDISRVPSAMDKVLEVGSIECNDGRYYIHNWTEYQRRAGKSERQAKYREKQRLQASTCRQKSLQASTGDAKRLQASTGITQRLTVKNMETQASPTERNGTERNKTTAIHGGGGTDTLPQTIECPVGSCSGLLTLRTGKDGSRFYGHGHYGGPMGCRNTLSVAEYKASIRRPTKTMTVIDVNG